MNLFEIFIIFIWGIVIGIIIGDLLDKLSDYKNNKELKKQEENLGKIKIQIKKNNNAILFKDINEKDEHVLAEIGLVYYQKRLTIFMKGYPMDDEEFPSLQGYYANTMSKEELNEFIKFLIEKVIEK